MGRKHRAKDREKDSSAHGPSSSELKDLDAFCSDVQLEEISFDCWKEQHSKLDLRYPLVIRRSELQQTFKTVIRLTRTIKDFGTQGRRVELKERIEHLVELDESQLKQNTIRVPGLGDRVGDQVGDLLIILEIHD